MCCHRTNITYDNSLKLSIYYIIFDRLVTYNKSIFTMQASLSTLIKKYPWIASVMVALGTALFLAGHTISYALYGQVGILRLLNVNLWLLVVGNFIFAYLEPRFPRKITYRISIILILFGISFFSPFNDYLDFTAGTLSIIALLMLTAGLILWRSAYPRFAQLWKIISKQRAIPSIFFPLASYGLFLSLAIFFSWKCFTFVPGYDDATAQYVQGKFVAKGQLYGQSPTLRHFFPVPMSVNDGKWYAQYQPLHVFMMAFGHLIGAPWIINPLSGALTVFLICLITRRIFGEATARIAAMLSVVCSSMLFMSAEFMNHPTALLFTTLMIYCYIETLESFKLGDRKTSLWACSTGLAAGAIFLVRPLTAIGVALPLAIYGIILLRRDLKRYLKPFSMMMLCGMLCVAFDLWYNKQLTGAMFVFPTGKYHGSSNLTAMGYGKYFSVWYILTKAENEWSRFNRQFFEWWLPSTFFVMIYCLLPVRQLYARLLLGVIISQTLVNFGNQFSSTVFGPRYIYEVSSSVIILSAAGITRIPVLFRTMGIRIQGTSICNGIVAIIMLLIVAFGAIFRIPFAMGLYANNFFDHHPDFYNSMIQHAEPPALIFIGRGGNTEEKYKWVRHTNPPDDTSPVIFALDFGNDKDKDLADHYTYRNVYIEFQDRLIPFNDAISGKAPTIPDKPPKEKK